MVPEPLEGKEASVCCKPSPAPSTPSCPLTGAAQEEGSAEHLKWGPQGGYSWVSTDQGVPSGSLPQATADRRLRAQADPYAVTSDKTPVRASPQGTFRLLALSVQGGVVSPARRRGSNPQGQRLALGALGPLLPPGPGPTPHSGQLGATTDSCSLGRPLLPLCTKGLLLQSGGTLTSLLPSQVGQIH